jgi:F1F0 ATPase subunit 2
MADPLTIVVFAPAAFAAGAALGWFFYAGLYRTVRELTRSRRPALLLSGSLLTRIAVLLAGLWLVMAAGEAWLGDSWHGLIPALLGLLAVRALLLRLYGRPGTGTRPNASSL